MKKKIRCWLSVWMKKARCSSLWNKWDWGRRQFCGFCRTNPLGRIWSGIDSRSGWFCLNWLTDYQEKLNFQCRHQGHVDVQCLVVESIWPPVVKFVQLRDRKAMLADEEVVPVFGLGNHFDYQSSGLLYGLIINLLYIKVILFDLIIGHFSGP